MKSKIRQGVKHDYNDGLSKSTKFEDVLNFYKKTVKCFRKYFWVKHCSHVCRCVE